MNEQNKFNNEIETVKWNQTETLVLKNSVNLKQKKESVRIKTGTLKLSSQRGTQEKE